jgi:hypothetical protein
VNASRGLLTVSERLLGVLHDAAVTSPLPLEPDAQVDADLHAFLIRIRCAPTGGELPPS